METGRWRFDNPLNQFYSKKQQRDPDLLLDDVSEVPRPPEQVEDNPPEKNADTGYAETVKLPPALPVEIVPGTNPLYRRYTSHGFTVNAFASIPKQILNASDRRIRATIRNVGGSGTLTVNVGPDGDSAKADGYPLENNCELVIVGTNALWGFVSSSTATDYVQVGVFVEYAWVIE